MSYHHFYLQSTNTSSPLGCLISRSNYTAIIWKTLLKEVLLNLWKTNLKAQVFSVTSRSYPESGLIPKPCFWPSAVVKQKTPYKESLQRERKKQQKRITLKRMKFSQTKRVGVFNRLLTGLYFPKAVFVFKKTLTGLTRKLEWIV